jgi:PAT family beta-lactamase induction signal transducer AmpG
MFRDRRIYILLALGFSSGLPSPLVFSSLSLWLKDVGVSRTDIGLFALATTPYAINFLWAPLVDRLPLPFFTRVLGQRRGWALAVQLLLMVFIGVMASLQPAAQLWWMALTVVCVAAISATLDIVLDAFRVELAGSQDKQGPAASFYIYGWYIGGMFVGGAGGLYLAESFGWNIAYAVLALASIVGMVGVLMSPEPTRATPSLDPSMTGSFGWLKQTLIAPLKEFTQRQGWALILIFVFVFRLGDALLGRMSGVFYREMGFSLTQIADVTKVFGFVATLVGIGLGGVLASRLGVLRSLFLAGLATALTNLTYSWLALSGQSFEIFVTAVVADNFTGGLVTVAFVAYLSSLCSTAFTATQYALLASLGNLARIWFSGSSGWIVDQLNGNWALFFAMTSGVALLGLPLLIVLMLRFPQEKGGLPLK